MGFAVDATGGLKSSAQYNRYHGDGLSAEGQSALLDNLPGVGTVKSGVQLATGKDAVTGEDSSGWGNGVALLAGLIPGGKLGVRVVEDVAVDAEKLLFRRGASDTKALLQRDAQAAEDVLGVHGVSVSTSPAAKAGQVVRCATCSSVEAAGFKVQQTGKDLNHHTVELPKPVTSEVVRIWNELFK